MSIYASIDMGSNTVRLLVAKITNGVIETLHSSHRITRLGKGLKASGNLDPDSVEATIKAIQEFKEEAKPYNPKDIWIAATSAVRRADNKKEFMAKVFEETDLEIEIIPWEDEASMAVLGVNYALKLEQEFLLFDIGGGSTEFILSRNGEIINKVGTELGVVTLSETHLFSNPPLAKEVSALEKDIDKGLAPVLSEINISQDTILVGTAGTVTTIAALDMDMFPYNPEKINGHIMHIVQLEDIKNRLLGMQTEDIINIPQIEEGREDLIATGAVLTCKIMESLGFKELLVSDYGLREGIILSHALKPKE